MNRLLNHIDHQQRIACSLQGILEGLEILIAEDAPRAAKMTLIELGIELAKEINTGLDAVNLPAEG